MQKEYVKLIMTRRMFDGTKYSRKVVRRISKHVIRFDPLLARRPWKQRSIRASFGSTVFLLLIEPFELLYIFRIVSQNFNLADIRFFFLIF